MRCDKSVIALQSLYMHTTGLRGCKMVVSERVGEPLWNQLLLLNRSLAPDPTHVSILSCTSSYSATRLGA